MGVREGGRGGLTDGFGVILDNNTCTQQKCVCVCVCVCGVCVWVSCSSSGRSSSKSSAIRGGLQREIWRRGRTLAEHVCTDRTPI